MIETRFDGLSYTPAEKKFMDEVEMIRALKYSNAHTQGEVAKHVLEDMKEEKPIIEYIEKNPRMEQIFADYFDVKEDLALAIINDFESKPEKIAELMEESKELWEICEGWLYNIARKEGVEPEIVEWTQHIKEYRLAKDGLLESMIERRTKGIH